MPGMRFTAAFTMFEPSQLIPLAQVAERAGFDSVCVPDSVFYPEQVSAPYPYTRDGERFWSGETPFTDPFVAVPAMAAVTTRLRFYTNVLKFPLRSPLLVAKQVSSIAVLSNDRFALGVGLSWIQEEFDWTQTDKRTRGARTDEAIEIVRKVCAGGGPQWVEHHGKHYDFDRLMISPAPKERVPIWVGGHSEPALKRAARTGDGWISVNVKTAAIAEAIDTLTKLRADAGRANEPFDISVMATDAFDLDGYRRLEDLGVTHVQCVPWYFGGGDPEALDTKIDSLKRFGDEIISRYDA
jgi:probable F420-dependent oxidoreductase